MDSPAILLAAIGALTSTATYLLAWYRRSGKEHLEPEDLSDDINSAVDRLAILREKLVMGEQADDRVNREIYDIVERLGDDVKHLSDRMREAGWKPPLESLEELTSQDNSSVKSLR